MDRAHITEASSTIGAMSGISGTEARMQLDARIDEILDTAPDIGEARRRIASCLHDAGLSSSEHMVDSMIESALGGDVLVVDEHNEPTEPKRRERARRLFGHFGRDGDPG